MEKKNRVGFLAPAGLLLLFIAWTAGVKYLDVKAIGPRESQVGFAAINGWFHELTGVHMGLYTLTDWLGFVPIFICLFFAVFGLVQWIRRRKISRVDADILLLGGFYLLVMAVYILFEFVVINRRPVLIGGYLEASYPSSTTILVMCVMPTALMQAKNRIKNALVRNSTVAVFVGFTVFMVLGRLACGVHWLSDIVGGVWISCALILLYRAANDMVSRKKDTVPAKPGKKEWEHAGGLHRTNG